MRFVLVIGVCFLFVISAYARQVPQTTADRSQNDLERRMSNIGLSGAAASREAVQARRAKLFGRKYRAELTDRFKQRMAIDQSLSNKFEKDMAAGRTGLVKLISPLDCKKAETEGKLLKCLQENANILEFANGFSFRETKRSVFARSDVALGGEYFVTGRHSVQTIIVDLGDKPLDELTVDSQGISHLVSFKPSDQEKKVDEEFLLYKNGLTVASFATGKEQKFNFGKVSKIVPNTTYALRTVAYRPPGVEPLPKDKDVLVVFRVVKVDEKGDTTILWREESRTEGLVMINKEAES